MRERVHLAFGVIAGADGEGQSGHQGQAEQAPRRTVSVEEVEGEQDGGRDAEGKLQKGGEEARRHEADEDAAGGAAAGHHEVEEGQSVGRGAGAREFAVAEHAADEERGAEDGDLPMQSAGRAFERDARTDGGPGGRHEPAEERGTVPAFGFEAEDEGEEIDGHGRHPEERHGGHLLAEIIGDGQPQGGGAGGEGDPAPRARFFIGGGSR